MGKYRYETLRQPQRGDAGHRQPDRLLGGTAPGPAGLLNLSGVTNGGTVAGDLDAVVDPIAAIEDAGDKATHIVASPTACATVSKHKASPTATSA